MKKPIKDCAHCEHWRRSGVKEPTIGRCAERIREALSNDMFVRMSLVNQWTNPNDTCEKWEKREA